MAKKNPGKIFEDDFKDSIPEYCMFHRLKDSAQAYTKAATFTHKNPFDCFVFDTKNKNLYACELKSTKAKSMSFESSKDDDDKMIHWHQIEGLRELAKYDGVLPCFILNFRNDEDNLQRTYFIHINDFDKMIESIGKKSFNEIDLLLNGAKKIFGELKRTHYKWDIESLFNN